ncbi:MAG: hypothetical protein QNJ60_01785 [Xenococcaceae cyanobacterium MO_188.B19]|nr:hypothetical protein [Xenococcaceae cyanobacterium MO_188.B19]
MTKKLFTRIHDQNKRKINISIDPNLKIKLKELKSIDGISTSERIEALYRNHRKLVEGIFVPNLSRSRGERGKPMFGDRVKEPYGIFLTPKAIAFFEKQAKKKNTRLSQIIEAALKLHLDS